MQLSDDRAEPIVDLSFVGHALQRLTAEVASLRDDMHVMTAIVLRHDRQFDRMQETLNEVLDQLRAMVTQHQRFGDKLRQLDGQR